MIVVIFGPGGVGKGTLVARLVAGDDRLWLSRSWTTRPRRANESPDAYVFVDRDQFMRHVEAGGFVEWDDHFGNLYGTPKVDTPPDKDLVYEIDVNGAHSIHRLHPEALVILVEPPSAEVLRQRLLARGDDAEAVEMRLKRAVEELERGRPIAGYIVVNDDLDQAVQEVAGILDGHRNPGGSS
jgi:guanylate kinase